jgi:hypothetical protein
LLYIARDFISYPKVRRILNPLPRPHPYHTASDDQPFSFGGAEIIVRPIRRIVALDYDCPVWAFFTYLMYSLPSIIFGINGVADDLVNPAID